MAITYQAQDTVLFQKRSKWKTFATFCYRFPHANLRSWHDQVLAPRCRERVIATMEEHVTAANAILILLALLSERAKWFAVRKLPLGTVDFIVVSAHDRSLGTGSGQYGKQ